MTQQRLQWCKKSAMERVSKAFASPTSLARITKCAAFQWRAFALSFTCFRAQQVRSGNEVGAAFPGRVGSPDPIAFPLPIHPGINRALAQPFRNTPSLPPPLCLGPCLAAGPFLNSRTRTTNPRSGIN